MTTTTPSAEIASTVDRAQDGIAHATSILARRRLTSGQHTDGVDTQSYLTYGSLLSGRSGSEPMVIRQLSPWNMCSAGAALQLAMTDVRDTLGTRTNGDVVTLVFATPAWHLLIATTNTELPSAWAGGLSESVRPGTWRFLSARLCAQPQMNGTTFSNALSVWHVVVPVQDDEATSRFLSTVLGMSQGRLIPGLEPSK